MTAPVQLTPLVAALAMLAESAIANKGVGVVPLKLPTAFASVVTVSSFAAWKVTEPLTADTVLVDSMP